MLAVQVSTNKEWKAFKVGQHYARNSLFTKSTMSYSQQSLDVRVLYLTTVQLYSVQSFDWPKLVIFFFFFFFFFQKQKPYIPRAMFEAHIKPSKQKAINSSSRQNP